MAVSKRHTVRELETHVTPISSFKDIEQLIPLVPLLVAITGRVWCKEPVPCALSDQQGAIVELREEKKTESRASDVWLSGTEPLRTVVREKPWAIVQPADAVFGQQGAMAEDLVMVPVLDGSHARGSYFVKSGEIFHPVEESIMQHVVAHVSGHRSLGTRQVERVLPTGQLVTAVGELCRVVDDPKYFEGAIRGGDGNMIALKAPSRNKKMFILSSSSFPDIIDVYRGAAASTRTASLYFIAAGSTMLLVTCYRRCRKMLHERAFVKRFREALKEKKKKRAHVSEETQSPNDAEEEDATSMAGVCVICLDKRCTLAYAGCGHLCVCPGCSTRGSARTMCPVCRTRGKPIVIYSVS
ncbi:hypothetical protein M9434_005825 [Picochlorum sp. BPE23]|nr:hypothetical protein M9434_005825 [Picochlorum sp. BPE23]